MSDSRGDNAMVKVFRKWNSKVGSKRKRLSRSFGSTASLPEHRTISAADYDWDLESHNSSILSPTSQQSSIDSGYCPSEGTTPRSEGKNIGDETSKAQSNDLDLPLVVYNKSSSPQTLPDAFQAWMFHADVLLKSKEMQALMGSTCGVAVSTLDAGGAIISTAGGVVFHTMCLPVTLPLNIATSAVGLIVEVTGNAARITFGGDSSCGESTSSTGPVEGMIQGIFSVVPVVAGTAGRITQEVGSAAVGIVSSLFGMENKDKELQHSHRRQTSSGERSSEQDSFLDRLRLDIHVAGNDPLPITVSNATASDITKYLLRVDDLNVYVSQDNPASPVSSMKVLFIDLGKEFADESLTTEAMDQLSEKGLNVAGSNRDANVSLFHPLLDRADSHVNWKPEGSTSKMLRKMGQQSILECYKSLESTILIWSGKFLGPKHYGSDNPYFLARGVVKRNPREFMNLLWDSERTNEYNKFSLGRTDVRIIEDNIVDGGSYGAKVIRSETKVPFTSMKVYLSALMHARALEGGSEEGFVIVSRSLSAGMAGCHVGGRQRVDSDSKNEILLGVNIMRAVPGKPDMTDLISISQVSSKMVPSFLTYKIGMMGVEDFFNNVR